MKILVVASALDLSLPYGCTPAWWQLLKGLHENGAEVIVTPYQGRPIESLWWRTYDNPCYRLGAMFAGLLRMKRWLPRLRAARPADGREGFGQRLQRRLVRRLVTPRWLRHLTRILEQEKDVAAVLVLTVPLNHLCGIPTALRERFGVPVIYYDGDLPASLPGFGGFGTGFSIYHGADISEYDAVLSNSQGATEDVRRLGARQTEVVWWGADPNVFRPADEDEEDIDVFFYGLGTEYRAEWLRDMIAVPSRELPKLRFVVAGSRLDIDLGRAERVGLVPMAELNRLVKRSRLSLNVARGAHASVYASATTRLFELGAMGRAIVSNPLLGLHEWFEPGQEVAVVHNAAEAVRTYQRLIDAPEERRAMGRAVRERVLCQHTYGHRARQVMTILRSLRVHTDNMPTPPDISVCIPFYSGRDYLRKAIESVQEQTLSNWELLVSDDCGPEGAVEEIVLGYGDPRLRYVRNEKNLGMAANWNRCLDLARAPLATLLHADDELLPGYCARMVRAAAEHRAAAAIFCGARIIGSDGEERFSFPDFVKRVLAPPGHRHRVLSGEPALRAILRGNFIMCPTLCYRLSRLGPRRFSSRWRFTQDMDLIARLLLEGETIVGLSEIEYAYRRHPANATVSYTENLYRFEEEAALYDAIGAAARQQGWHRAARVAAGKRIIKMNLTYCMLMDVCRLRPRQAWRKAAHLARML